MAMWLTWTLGQSIDDEDGDDDTSVDKAVVKVDERIRIEVDCPRRV